MKRIMMVGAVVALMAQPALAAEAKKTDAPAMPVVNTTFDVPTGTYTLDPTHASLTFKVNHLGLSHYTARFTKMEAILASFDAKNPTTATLDVKVDPASLKTDFPNKTPDFDAELRGEQWLDAKKFPTITFKSTKLEVTGKDTGKVTGDFTLHGITKPLVLDVQFHGGYASIPMDPSGDSRIGFSATTKLNRSDFGIGYGVPAAGSTLGVSDQIDVIIEAEFVKPNKKAK